MVSFSYQYELRGSDLIEGFSPLDAVNFASHANVLAPMKKLRLLTSREIEGFSLGRLSVGKGHTIERLIE